MKEFRQIISDLKNKVYHPIYLLQGEESYYIDRISDFIEDQVLTDIEKEFNQTVLYGLDSDIPTLVSVAKRYPMMANYQVVIVKEAQMLRNIDDLASYAANPLKSTILVICHKNKSVDGRKQFAKTVKKTGIVFDSKKIHENQIPGWIKENIEGAGFKINDMNALMLADYLGNDLSRITNETSKLFLNIQEGSDITPELIEQYIGISKDFNVFELINALGRKDIFKANRIVNYFIHNPKEAPMVVILINFFRFFQKLLIIHSLHDKSPNNVATALKVNPYFVKDYLAGAKHYSPNKLRKIFSTLRKYDLMTKGVDNASTGEGELLKELVFKILH
ncbi:MAG: DNA polymerase III subunit delta [Bacteroidetes bacterium]|nr:DNA polymerase III subunit delta [Bacteroidota bacterium]MBU1719569.1 DNA polymerase III subunit delta [Bacteroidota bacterium]